MIRRPPRSTQVLSSAASDVYKRQGQKKYGAMMMEEVEGKDKDLNDFLTDVQEEIMDALLYIQAARHCLRDEVEECMMNRMNVIGQNGNDGLHYEEEEEL